MEFEQIATMDIEPRAMGMEIAAAGSDGRENRCGGFFEGLAEGFEFLQVARNNLYENIQK